MPIGFVTGGVPAQYATVHATATTAMTASPV